MKSLVTQYNSVWKLFIFIINSTTDAFENFTMVILSSLLASGPNSPFYQSLIAPNIGSDYSPGVGWVYYTLFDFQFTIYWDDHSSLSSTTAIQMWIISYIFHIISVQLAFLKLSSVVILIRKKVKKSLVFVKVWRQMVVSTQFHPHA